MLLSLKETLFYFIFWVCCKKVDFFWTMFKACYFHWIFEIFLVNVQSLLFALSLWRIWCKILKLWDFWRILLASRFYLIKFLILLYCSAVLLLLGFIYIYIYFFFFFLKFVGPACHFKVWLVLLSFVKYVIGLEFKIGRIWNKRS